MADARAAGVARLIDGLRRDRRQHPLRGRGEYSARVREVAGAIADMIESGRAADAVPLARRAVERVTAAMLHVDDSSGITGDDLRALTGPVRARLPGRPAGSQAARGLAGGLASRRAGLARHPARRLRRVVRQTLRTA
jgi:hypothetical protein